MAPAGSLERIRGLLEEAFEGQFSEDDWEHTLGGWHVVVVDRGSLVSHAACVPRVLDAAGRAFRTGYVEGVATAARRRREGLASLAVSRLTPLIHRHFEVGALSTGSHSFYERLGWERWRGPTFAHQGGELVRTREDDEGLMVLRFGPTLELDLAVAISCDPRSGDPW
jgi:aminoglycoside 2'-N-acetyltransferase I